MSAIDKARYVLILKRLKYIYCSLYRPFRPLKGHADYYLFKEKLFKENL
jgi:hypothetical protein